MEWNDTGIVLAARPHGESSAIVSLLTKDRGRHVGLMRGGRSKRNRGILEPGNVVAATWRARLAEHLGNYQCELTRARAAGLLDDPLRLVALQAACATMETALPERHPYPYLFDGLNDLLDAIGNIDGWLQTYVRWEVAVLRELGFGLDLSACAATGQEHDLTYVSPRTGRAVSQEAAQPYKDKLLILPEFLIVSGVEASRADILAGFRLTGWFLQHHALAAVSGRMPPARERMIARIAV